MKINVIYCSLGSWKKRALVVTLLINKTSVKFFHHIKPHTIMSTLNSQGLPTELTVISANIEGLTAVKDTMLSGMCKDKHCQCVCLQETHRSQSQASPRIPGMSLVAKRPHNKYGSAVIIRDDFYM